MDANDPTRFDLTFLRDFCEGDEEQVDYFIAKFKNQWPLEMEKLRGALLAEDRDTLAKAAHAFRPHLEFVGLKDDAMLVFELEQQARNNCSFKELLDSFNRLNGWK